MYTKSASESSPSAQCHGDREMPQEVSNFRRSLPQFLVVGVKNLILLGWGFLLGYPTILIPGLTNDPDFSLTGEEISWIASINLLCVPFGSLLSGVLTGPLGKRRVMQLLNLPMLVAWGLFYFSSNINHVFAGLCLCGMSGGLLEAPLLTYIAETVEPRFRGMLTATGTATVIGGVMLQFILGSFMPWRIVAAFSAIFPSLAFLAVFLVPESPYWLYVKGRVDEAHKSLQWLRGWVNFATVQKEFDDIVYAIERERSEKKSMNADGNCIGRVQPFKKRSFLQPFGVIVAAFFIGHFSGMTPLQTYAIQIFNALKTPIDEYYATILLGAAQFAGCTLGAIFIRSTGKRALVFASLIGNCVCFFAAATYTRYFSGLGSPELVFEIETSTVEEQAFDVTATSQWIPMILLLLGSMFAHMGIKMIPWMLIGEVYPSTCRSVAAGISSALGYLSGFLANKLFKDMYNIFSLIGTFWFYSGVAAVGLSILIFILPETENRSLLQIEAYFDRSKRDYLRQQQMAAVAAAASSSNEKSEKCDVTSVV